MTTLGELKAAVARDLRDPDAKVFLDADLGDFIRTGISDVGRVAPRSFQEDIEPVADQLDYELQADVLDAPVPEIEVVRVELWDGSTTPKRFLKWLYPMSAQPVHTTHAGWVLWNGVLSVTGPTESFLVPDKHLIRVWGYAPYVQPDSDDDVLGLSTEIEEAVKERCRVAGLRRLVTERDTFTQWQTRANNADVSPASLMNALAQAEDAWRRTKRELAVLREKP